MTFPEFLAKWTNPAGQRIDYDHAFLYQCVDLILQYVYECFGLAAGVRGNAIDYWEKPTATLLTRFSKVQTQDVREGDIVIISSALTKLAHIVLATGALSGNNFEAMEQNGGLGSGNGTGTDAIRCRWISKARIIGVLRPNAGMGGGPVMASQQDVTQAYRDILHREPDAGGLAHYAGHFTIDFVCNDMMNSVERKNWEAQQAAEAAAAAQAAAEAAARAEAAKTVPMPPSAPAGALVVPTSTEKYQIKTTLKTYSSVTDAVNRINNKGEIWPGGIWYKYCEKSGMVNITQTPGVTTGTWINPADNMEKQPEPVPAPTPAAAPEPPKPAPKVETETDVRHSFLPIMPDGSPIDCEVLQNVLVVDTLGKGNPITAYRGDMVRVRGTFTAAGRVYALLRTTDKATQNNYMYGIPVASHDNFEPYLRDIYKLSDNWRKNWELLYDKTYQTIDGIYQAVRKKLKKQGVKK